MRKRFVLSGYFGFKNFGDEAILSVLVEKLQSIGGVVSVITSDISYTKSKFKHIFCVKTFDLLNIIGAIKKSDYLVSGGGSLLQDVTSFKSLVYYLFILSIGLIFHKKNIIFAQGIGPVNSNLGRFLTRLILKRAYYISVRDEKSYELLKNWGINCDLVCDPVFGLNIEPIAKSKKVCVQLRNFDSVNDLFLSKLAEFIDKNFSGYEIEVCSLQDSIDLDVCKNFCEKLREIDPYYTVNLHKNIDSNKVISIISSCEYLIGMRFHSLIIGLLSGCKILALNYDPKVEKLANKFNLPCQNLNDQKFINSAELVNQDVSDYKKILEKTKFDWDNFLNVFK